jgi:hypothetical protein
MRGAQRRTRRRAAHAPMMPGHATPDYFHFHSSPFVFAEMSPFDARSKTCRARRAQCGAERSTPSIIFTISSTFLSAMISRRFHAGCPLPDDVNVRQQQDVAEPIVTPIFISLFHFD